MQCENCCNDISFIRQCDLVIKSWVLESNLDLHLAVPFITSMNLRELISWGFSELICKLKTIIFAVRLL